MEDCSCSDCVTTVIPGLRESSAAGRLRSLLPALATFDAAIGLHTRISTVLHLNVHDLPHEMTPGGWGGQLWLRVVGTDAERSGCGMRPRTP